MTYTPQWEGAYEGYARRFVHANHWKVAHTLAEPDDALQECVVVFLRCCRRYGDTVASAAHFMALYKRMLSTAFIAHARAGQRHRKAMEAVTRDELRAPANTAASAELVTALGEASPELRQVLQLIGATPNRLHELLVHDRGIPRHRHQRCQLSRAWCRVAGIAPPRSDLVDELQGLVTG